MAFHPMRTFQKNRKFWMAAVLLVCMFTFVLCTGLQGGDFAGWIMSLFRPRGNEAVALADPYPDLNALKNLESVSVRSFYMSDLDDVKKRREIANDYMNRAAKLVLDNLRNTIKAQERSRDNEKQQQQLLRELTGIRADLTDKLSRPRYFRGGVGLNDLVDFLLWRSQANRLGIRLTDDVVRDMVALELYSAAGYARFTGWGPEASLRVQRLMGKNYREIVDALTDEFRVRIARLALQESAWPTFAQSRFNPALGKATEPELGTRSAMTPWELFSFYRKNRSPAKVAVLPVPLEDLFSKLPKEDPAEYEKKLKQLYDQFKEKKYDPSKPEPGFQPPERVVVEYVSADPKSPAFTAATRTITLLLQTRTPTADEYRRFWDPKYRPKSPDDKDKRVVQFRPFLFNPTQSPFLAAASYAAQQPVYDQMLANLYARERARPGADHEAYELPDWLDSFALPLLYRHWVSSARRWAAETKSEGAPLEKKLVEAGESSPIKTLVDARVRLIGSLAGSAAPGHFLGGVTAGLAAYQDTAVRQGEQLEPVLDAEREKRFPMVAAAVGSGTTLPLNTLTGGLVALADYASKTAPPGKLPGYRAPRHAPLLGLVEKTFREKFETNLAVKRAREIMLEVRGRLIEPQVAGHAETFRKELNALLREYNEDSTLSYTDDSGEPRESAPLVYRKRLGPHTPFDIGKDPALAPLKKSFERVYEQINLVEGRGGTPSMLKKSDFDKLFFGLEKFGVGSAADYEPRPWPPVLKEKLTRAQILAEGEEAAQPKTVNLFETADRAFMFWKTDSKKAEGNAPQGLANPVIRAMVERALKIEKARELLFARAAGAKKQRSEFDQILKLLIAAANEKAKGHGRLQVAFENAAHLLGKDRRPIILDDVAPLSEKVVQLVTYGGQFTTFYVPYEVPDGTFLYPREDTPKEMGSTKQILALLDLKAPLTIGDTQLDKLNQELFDNTHKTGRVVQVLTNSPKTVYYVVAVVVPPYEDPSLAYNHFFTAYRGAAGLPPRDFLVTLAYQEISRSYHQALLAQMRTQARVRETDDAKKQFPDSK
jgi:hypothetical protein